jgi:hypothetical protein
MMKEWENSPEKMMITWWCGGILHRCTRNLSKVMQTQQTSIVPTVVVTENSQKQPMNSCYLAGEEGVRWCGGSHTTRRTTSNHGSTFSKNGFGCKGKGQGGGSVCFREKTELI